MTTPPNYPYPGQPGGQPGFPPQPGFQPPQGFPPPQGYPGQQPPQGYGYPPPGGYAPNSGFQAPQGFPPGGFPPPAPQRRSGGAGKAILITVVVALIGLAYGAVVLLRSDGAKVAVGECAKLSGSTFKAEFAIKECTDPEANYVVAQRIDGANKDCLTKDYASYYVTGSNGYTLCLRLNVQEGDCIHSTALAASTKVPCTATADYKIGKIVRGAADKSACGAKFTDDSTIVYPKPDPITLCLVPPK